MPLCTTRYRVPRQSISSAFHSPAALRDAFRRRHNCIQATTELVGLELGVAKVGVVENLDLDPRAFSVMAASLRHSHVHARVPPRLQPVFQPEVEIPLLLSVPQPGAALSGAQEESLFCLPALRRLSVGRFPPFEVLTVEQRPVAGLLNLDVTEKELASAGYFGLQGDIARRRLDPVGLPGRFTVDLQFRASPRR